MIGRDCRCPGCGTCGAPLEVIVDDGRAWLRDEEGDEE
jgi:hypothetical protein